MKPLSNKDRLIGSALSIRTSAAQVHSQIALRQNALMNLEDLDCKTNTEGVSVLVKVKPRATRSRFVGVRQGLLEIALDAPPVDGKANAALCRFLAEQLSLAARDVKILGGEQATRKRLQIAHLTREQFLSRLGPLLPDPMDG
jgi:hypothetical protein